LATSTTLTGPAQIDSLTMKVVEVKKVEKKPKPVPVKPEFQSHFELANNYLDKAISGQAKFYGSSLREIDKAIAARPKSLPAKQLKVEILYNFAQSLKESKLLREASNRCEEALKLYNQIPQDQRYDEIQKLKSEIDKSMK
jgi:tetratricopeptide (TPR) repeat protein